MFNRFGMEITESSHRSCDPFYDKHENLSFLKVKLIRLLSLRGSGTKPFFYESLRLGR